MADLDGLVPDTYGGKQFNFVKWNSATGRFEAGLSSPDTEAIVRETLRLGAATPPGGVPQDKMRELFATPNLYSGAIVFTDDPVTFLRLKYGREPTATELETFKREEGSASGLAHRKAGQGGTVNNVIYLNPEKTRGQYPAQTVGLLTRIVLHEFRHIIVPDQGHGSPYDPKTGKFDPKRAAEVYSNKNDKFLQDVESSLLALPNTFKYSGGEFSLFFRESPDNRRFAFPDLFLDEKTLNTFRGLRNSLYLENGVDPDTVKVVNTDGPNGSVVSSYYTPDGRLTERSTLSYDPVTGNATIVTENVSLTTFTWLTTTETFTPYGERMSHTVLSRDNSTETTTWDVGNLQSWLAQTEKRDPNGTLIGKNTYNDDGTRMERWLDTYNTDPNGLAWGEDRYDAVGVKTSFVLQWDSGWNGLYTLDAYNTQNWSRLDEIRTPAGALDQIWRNYDDGRVDKTFYDVANNQPWREYTDKFDATGARVERDQLKDDGGTYRQWFDPHNATADGLSGGSNTYDAAGTWMGYEHYYDVGGRYQRWYDPYNTNPDGLSGGSNTYDWTGAWVEYQHFYDDGRRYQQWFDPHNTNPEGLSGGSNTYDWTGAHVEYQHFYDDGRRYQRWYDPHNTNPDGLSGGSNSYDAAGTWSGYEHFFDDGRRIRNVFDSNNTQPWSSYTEYYNSSGQHTEDIWYHDGGGRNRNVFDFNNNQPWSSYSEYYNASGQHTEDVWYRDDGGRNRNVFDVNGDQPWSSYSELFDANGRNTDGIRYYDDGRRDHWQWDPANTQAWSSRLINYDASGQWTTQNGVWDDGTTFRGETRTGVPYYMWSWKIETYDQNGNMTRINGGYPDGWTFDEIRDPYNTQPWWRTWNDYDQNGTRMENQGNLDSGGWWHTWYDPYNTAGWSSFTQVANADSYVFKEITVGDDGSVTERRIDTSPPRNGFGLANMLFKNIFDPVNLLQSVLFGDPLIVLEDRDW